MKCLGQRGVLMFEHVCCVNQDDTIGLRIHWATCLVQGWAHDDATDLRIHSSRHPGTALMSENGQLNVDQDVTTYLRIHLGRSLVQGLGRSEHAQCGVDHDDATDLRIRLVKCLVKRLHLDLSLCFVPFKKIPLGKVFSTGTGLRLCLSTCIAAWIRMKQSTLESIWRGA